MICLLYTSKLREGNGIELENVGAMALPVAEEGGQLTVRSYIDSGIGVVDYSETVSYTHLIVAVLAAVQYTQIRTLFKSIYFGKTIEEKIQAVFSGCPKVDLRNTHITYLQLFGMTIVMVLGNLFWFVVSISA